MDETIIPVFSGGVGRSGTTLVGRTLRSHSEVCVGSPFEIKFLTETYGLIDLVFGMRKFPPTQISRKGAYITRLIPMEPIKFRFWQFRRRIRHDWWLRTNRLGIKSGLHRAMTLNQMEILLEELGESLDKPVTAARNFLFGFVRNHRKWQGEKFWMDTTPANIAYSDYIYRIFPEARFVEMHRNPFDNIGSIIKEPWGPNSEEHAIAWWRDRTFLAEEAKKSIPSSQFLSMKLENFVKFDRDRCYETLLNFLPVADEAKVRRYFEEEVSGERAHIGRWKSDFSSPEAFSALFVSIVGADYSGKY